MNITLTITPKEIFTLARVINARESNSLSSENDLAESDDILRKIIGQAAILHGVSSPEIRAVIERDYARFNRTRRMPPSRRTVI